jgi:hypothetical protein
MRNLNNSEDRKLASFPGIISENEVSGSGNLQVSKVAGS